MASMAKMVLLIPVCSVAIKPLFVLAVPSMAVIPLLVMLPVAMTYSDAFGTEFDIDRERRCRAEQGKRCYDTRRYYLHRIFLNPCA